MAFKINISDKEKTWKIEAEIPGLVGKSISDMIPGKLIKPELEGYELKITGGTDFAGFPMSERFEGIGLNRAVLKKGFSMKSPIKGLRRRKSIRGKTIAEKTTIQINMVVSKAGTKSLSEIFPEQNKAPLSSPQGIEEERGSSSKSESEMPIKTEVSATTEAPQEKPTKTPKTDDTPKKEVKKEEGKPMTKKTKKKEIAEEIAGEVKEEIQDDIPTSPETDTEEEKEEAAKKVAEEVKEEVEDVAEEISEDEEKTKEKQK